MNKNIIRKLSDYVSEHALYTNHIRPMLRYIIKNNNRNNLIGCEVGVHDGKHAFNMLYHLPTTKVYLVDVYKSYDGYVFKDSEKVYLEAKNRLKVFGNRAVFIRKFSDKITNKDIPDGCLDFCYIDANHSYDFFKKDIKLFYKKMKVGGILGGHDFYAGSDVAPVVLDFVCEHGLELKGSVTDWWIVKKKLR